MSDEPPHATESGQVSAAGTALDAAEHELLQRLQAGDDAAFQELVEQHGPRMLNVIRRIVPDEHEAQDALQEAFVQAFRAMDQFDGRSRLGTWLHRIAVNAALMRLRRKRRKRERSIEDLLPKFGEDGHRRDVGPAWEQTPLNEAEAEERRAQVRASIAELPTDYRDVLMLRDIEQLDTQETAEQLGISPGAVKTRLHRARQALRELLAGQMREPSAEDVEP